MSLDAVISADLVKTRAEIAALSSAVASARSEIAGLNSQVSNSSALKSLQRLRVQPSGSAPYYSDVAIAAINPQKTTVLIRQVNPNVSAIVFDCEILSPTVLRCWNYLMGSDYKIYSAGVIDIQVVEFK